MARKYTYSQNGNVVTCDQTGEIKRIQFGSEWFDFCGATDCTQTFYGNIYNEIYKVYGKPSDRKVAIWTYWCKWAEQHNAQLKIAGHSCMFFSITGFIIDDNGDKYNLWITYANQRCTLVK